MSINSISKDKRLEVLVRLLKNNESIEVACSKSALTVEEAKNYLAKK